MSNRVVIRRSNLKKVFSVLLALCLLLSSAPLAGFLGLSFPHFSLRAFAASADDLTFALSEDETYYAVTDCDSAASGELTIPSTYNGKPVISIGNDAFEDCTELTAVTISDSVESIGGGAFAGCTGLTSVTIPDSVTSIDQGAFRECTALTSVKISNSVTNIGYRMFSYCISLTSIIIPDSVTQIDNFAFDGCTALTTVTIPDSVTHIGCDAFYDTPWINNQPDGIVYAGKVAYMYKGEIPEDTAIVIEDGTKIISDALFPYCYKLTSVTIPDSVTSIGDGAFSNCFGLTAINVSSLNTAYSSVDGVLFDKEITELLSYPGGKSGAYTIPNSVTSIHDYAFEGCTGLTSVAIPDSATDIGMYAFCGCPVLTSVTIPDSVKSIEYGAFGYCDVNRTVRVDGFKIYCYSGTAGFEYAVDNGFDYKVLTGEEVTLANGSGLTVTNADTRILSGIKCGDTVEAVLGKFTSSENVKIYSSAGTEITDTALKLGTGTVIKKLAADGEVLDGLTASVKGDVDGDGAITTTDAREALRAAAKLTVLNDAQNLAAEVDGDSTGISTSDARVLLRVAAKLETI